MKYFSDFSYSVLEGEEIKERGDNIPVHSFMVDGGANRIITLASTDDISIMSELEQARSFKNVTLFLSPNKNGSDMRVALELNNLYLSGKSLVLQLFIERLANGQVIESFGLMEGHSRLKFLPYVVSKNLLTLHLKLTDPMLNVGRRQGEGWSVDQV
jgi:hypothetical protein